MTRFSTDGREKIPDKEFAFPKEHKEPLKDAAHVRNAIARFNQVDGVSENEKDAAWKRIQKAAKRFNIELNEESRTEFKRQSKKK